MKLREFFLSNIRTREGNQPQLTLNSDSYSIQPKVVIKYKVSILSKKTLQLFFPNIVATLSLYLLVLVIPLGDALRHQNQDNSSQTLHATEENSKTIRGTKFASACLLLIRIIAPGVPKESPIKALFLPKDV